MRQQLPTAGIGIFIILCFFGMGLSMMPAYSLAQSANGQMTKEKALMLAEKFGVDVGEVDQEIQEILGLTKAEGVVVFAVIGGSPAELSGIKVKAVIKEVDIYEIRNLLDLGNALEKTLETPNFTVATYEPMTGVGVTGGLNFHFVRILQD
jgi:membrane-associated protease RseP (regulator of RpoE activity)